MRRWKSVAGMLAVSLPPILWTIGCGGAVENDTVMHAPASEKAKANTWSISDTVVAEMRTCARKHARELKTYSHEAKLDLTVTDDGDVRHVRLHSSTLHHNALESCLMTAVTAVSVPSSALTLRSSEPASGGEWPRDAREALGVAQVLGAAAAAGPVILIAFGVTIVVYVAAVATEEAIEATKRRTKRDKFCYDRLYECVGRRLECSACFIECKNRGVWDERKCPLSSSH